MVAAQKGSTARKIEYQTEKRPQLRLAEPPARMPQAGRVVKPQSKAKPIVLLILGFILAIVVVTRFSIIAQNANQIHTLKNELSEVEKKTASLEHQLNSVQNLDVVMNEASKSLAMNAPSEDQVRYVSLPMTPSEAQAQAQAQEQERQSASAGSTSPIGEFFSRVVSWLD